MIGGVSWSSLPRRARGAVQRSIILFDKQPDFGANKAITANSSRLKAQTRLAFLRHDVRVVYCKLSTFTIVWRDFTTCWHNRMYDRQEGNYIWLVRPGHATSSLQQTVSAQEPRQPSVCLLTHAVLLPLNQPVEPVCPVSHRRNLRLVFECVPSLKKINTETVMSFTLQPRLRSV